MPPSRDPEVDRLLRDVGWFPGRCVPEAVAFWRSALEACGFVMHLAAEAVLLEYGGLHVGGVWPGLDVARLDLELNPTLAVGERDRFKDYFPELQGRAVFPVGEAHRGRTCVGVSASGEVFLLMDQVYGRWPSFEAALRGLLLGIRAPEV